jgi:TolB protein
MRLARVIPFVAVLPAFLVLACSEAPTPVTKPAEIGDALTLPQEKHLKNMRQLTFEGENAEAYFSFDGKKLTFMSTGPQGCDQIYTMNIDGTARTMVSTGKGRTTCSYYYPDGQHILYASTHLGGDACPPVPDKSNGYVWPIYDSYDIFRANADGSGLERLTKTAGYDAEATIAKDGTIVFTSVRDGDMEIYTMNGDGTDVRRLTHLPGPDGGAFFSADGSKIVFRGRHPEKGPELDEYFTLLKKALWKPAGVDVFVMNRDGSNLHQVTKGLGGANWAPFFTPDGKQIIFASNMKDPRGGNFDLYLINEDGTGLEQITYADSFDGFPIFSPDGSKIAFASGRHSGLNVFIADWVK